MRFYHRCRKLPGSCQEVTRKLDARTLVTGKLPGGYQEVSYQEVSYREVSEVTRKLVTRKIPGNYQEVTRKLQKVTNN